MSTTEPAIDTRSTPVSGQSWSAQVHDLAVDRAYEEYLRRREAGEEIDRDEFCARYPAVYHSLYQVIQADQFLEENPQFLEDRPPLGWPEPGESFQGFRLVSLLGRGAFARVYLATEPQLGGRPVALKITPHGSAEAETLGRLSHPNIVPVYSVRYDEQTRLTAVCMPYLGRATLCHVRDHVFAQPQRPRSARLILEAVQETPADGPAPAVLRRGAYPDGVRWLGAQMAEALAFMHARGICHRDLKLSNVLLSPAGIPMLLDFNLSADSRQARQHLGGTLPYMSPEQLLATDQDRAFDPSLLDARSDVFSLGVILYELLAGTHPFGPLPLKLSSQELRIHLLSRQRTPPNPLRAANPDVDRPLARLVESCLAYNPADRPQSAAKLASALRQGLAPSPRACRWLGRHPRTVLAALLLLVLLVGGGALALGLRPPANVRHFQDGMHAYRQGDYHQAVEQFGGVLKADSTFTPALVARARTYQQLGEIDATYFHLALDDYQRADQRNPDGRVKAGAGYCLSKMGQPKPARDYYLKAIQAGFAPAEVHNNLGFCYLEINQLAEAQASLDAALGERPNLQAARHNRAQLWRRRAQFALQALEARQQAAANNRPVPGPQEQALVRTVIDCLDQGMADARAALAQGAATAELLSDTASLFALAARQNPDWTSQALDFAQRAVAHGLDPRRLARDNAFTPLRNQLAFQDLLKLPSPSQAPPRARRLLNPVTDWPH
jgi:serine/threonine protein kinase/Tfp pilus assembly protein PilF